MAMIEGLESRRMLTVVNVTDITADNRGEATIRLSGPVTNVDKRTVRIYGPGPDGLPNTLDDVLANKYSVVYDGANRITVRAGFEPNTRYRVRLQAQQIKSADDGSMLDGTFTGTFPTGDGVAGGNVNFFVRRNASTTPRVRMATTTGNIDVTLRGDLSGIKDTVDNFIRYADSGRLDGTIIHRKGRDEEIGIGIVQGGGFYGTAENSNGVPTQTVESFGNINLQAGVLSNLSGTLAMARQTAPNTASSQFFFNANDNTALDAGPGNDGYAVFGQVSNSSSMDAVTAMYNATNVSVGTGGTFSTLPRIAGQNIVVRRLSMLGKVDTLQ